MSKAIVMGLALLVAFSVGFVGCGGDEGGSTAAKSGKAAAKPAKSQDRVVTPVGEGGKAVMAKTPMEAWLNFNEASYTGDKALVLSSFHAPEEAKEAIAMGAMNGAGLFILRRELAEAYGEEALEGLFEGTKTEPFDRKKLEASTKIEEEGDKATAHLAGGGEIGLIKKDGAWYVDVDVTQGDFPTGDKLKEAVQYDIARLFSINQARAKIGTPGFPTVESVLQYQKVAFDARLKTLK